eukprot:COSAG02_NODE_31868_length_526_cov_0.704918_1_plen_20_part_10
MMQKAKGRYEKVCIDGQQLR